MERYIREHPNTPLTRVAEPPINLRDTFTNVQPGGNDA